jgi:membrane-associated phospholipid phosphatase
MPQTILIEARQEWQAAWSVPGFRRKLITAAILVITILSCYPTYFQRIEARQGVILNDPLLRLLPAHNVSIAIFILIWTLSALAIFRAVQTPRILLVFLWSYVLLVLLRTVTIALVPLDPPANLIGLMDPLSNFFYGPKFVTKDLFFSGHTSTMFLIFLCLPGRTDRRLALVVTFSVGFLLLVQHVHYTIDILGGFLFGWLSWWIAKHSFARES